MPSQKPAAAEPVETPESTLPDVPPAALAEDDGRTPVTVRLRPDHHAYLAERAARHGDTPERHLETILRTFRSYHDRERHGLDTTSGIPGMPAGTRRA
jgi:hypothetical protein